VYSLPSKSRSLASRDDKCKRRADPPRLRGGGARDDKLKEVAGRGAEN
jgi:hypothetical protein